MQNARKHEAELESRLPGISAPVIPYEQNYMILNTEVF